MLQQDEHHIPRLDPTKLHVPAVHPGHVVRQRLLDSVAGTIERSLMLVSAPAGFGKTTFVAQWVRTIPGDLAWVSLDDGDNDVAVVALHLVEAIRRNDPDALPRSHQIVTAPAAISAETLLEALLGELDELWEPTTLVLDDYQAISAQAVHDLVTRLVKHPTSGLHLVVVTRHDPPLPVDRLRGSGQVADVRAKDLRLTRDELRAVVRASLGDGVDDQTLATLERETEGWPAGVRLAVAAGRHRAVEDGVRGVAPFDSTYAHDYLLSEVLDHEPAAVREWLMAIAVLDRFSAPLCDALIEPADRAPQSMDGQGFVDWLVERDLFVIGLDRDRVWYRLHHTFRDLLLRQLRRRSTREVETRLRARAAEWCASHGFVDEAVRQCLAAADPALAASIIASRGQQLVEAEQFRLLLGWIDRLPPEVVDDDIELLMLRAWALMAGLTQRQRAAQTLGTNRGAAGPR